MTIRSPVDGGDWARVGELAEVLVRTHYAFDSRRFVPPDTLRAPDYIARLREEVDRGDAVVLVAEVDGAIAGYVFAGVEAASWKDLRDEAGYVHDLVVDAANRRGRHRPRARRARDRVVLGPRRLARDAVDRARQHRRAAALPRDGVPRVDDRDDAVER